GEWPHAPAFEVNPDSRQDLLAAIGSVQAVDASGRPSCYALLHVRCGADKNDRNIAEFGESLQATAKFRGVQVPGSGLQQDQMRKLRTKRAERKLPAVCTPDSISGSPQNICQDRQGSPVFIHYEDACTASHGGVGGAITEAVRVRRNAN